MTRKPRIHELLATPQSGQDIEALSFATIDGEAPSHSFTPSQWEVVRRMIHTTADFSLMDAVRFSSDATRAGVEALKAGRPLFVDSSMIRSGISLARLRAACERYDRESIHCHVADEDVTEAAEGAGLPRSILAVRKAKAVLDRSVAVFGNSPTALLELNRLIIEEGLRPALVIAVPVGFVHVRESKEEIMELDVPYICLAGRRGGSPVAVSIVHALCTLAGRTNRGRKPAEQSTGNFDAVILLGHGSRVPEASHSMRRVAQALREKGLYRIVETCSMSRMGPHFEETFERCVQMGACRVLLLPYFLHEGLHMKLDVPDMLQRAAKRYPQVRLVFGKNLGFDPLLVRLVEQRVGESAVLGDVRQMALPGEKDYPIPPGQCEFVAMPPEDAARWRAGQQETENLIQGSEGEQE